MAAAPKYSVVVPVYNRPEELEELLLSLSEQSYKDFEVIIVEDGSTMDSRHVYEKYASRLAIKYFVKLNSGPGPSRNFGFSQAAGAYFVVFDSDCILPPHYFKIVDDFLSKEAVDAWGGPDRGSLRFTPVQQAMAITMSSFLTTGGIRGGDAQSANYQPRSFNMGMSRKVFEKTGGFRFDRLAEDIELSIRMKNEGFKVRLIPAAFVYHKRRTSFSGFFKQVKGFGRGRVRVGAVHPEAIGITHWFPTFFLLGLFMALLAPLYSVVLGSILIAWYLFYFIAIAVDGYQQSASLHVALLCIPSALVQLSGYGIGFLLEKIKIG